VIRVELFDHFDCFYPVSRGFWLDFVCKKHRCYGNYVVIVVINDQDSGITDESHALIFFVCPEFESLLLPLVDLLSRLLAVFVE